LTATAASCSRRAGTSRPTPSIAGYLAEKLVLGPGSRFEYSSPSSYMLAAAVERVTGRAVLHETGARRAGDPPALVASSRRAESMLGWRAQRSSLDEIIAGAHRWREAHPHGYAR